MQFDLKNAGKRIEFHNLRFRKLRKDAWCRVEVARADELMPGLKSCRLKIIIIISILQASPARGRCCQSDGAYDWAPTSRVTQEEEVAELCQPQRGDSRVDM